MADLESELARFEAEIKASSQTVAGAPAIPPPPQAFLPPASAGQSQVRQQKLSAVHLSCFICMCLENFDKYCAHDRAPCAAYRQHHCQVHLLGLSVTAMQHTPLLHLPLGLNMLHQVHNHTQHIIMALLLLMYDICMLRQVPAISSQSVLCCPVAASNGHAASLPPPSAMAAPPSGPQAAPLLQVHI